MDGLIITLSDLIPGPPAVVDRTDTVAVAIDIVCAERLNGLPVLDGQQLVGLITPLQLLGHPPDRPIGDVMLSPIEPGTPDMLSTEGYRLMTRQGLDVLPVADAGRVVGVVARSALLETFTEQTDPLTGLPWAVSLRTWARRTLLEGREIAILFIDLDNFWLVNKISGHVTGDECLRTVARVLAGCVDRRTDTLCRYGGDEFAIGTTRQDADLGALVRRIRSAIDLPIDLAGSPHRLRASVGAAGGQRLESRADVHVSSLIEDLIAKASLASTVAKGSDRWDGMRSRDPHTAAIGVRPRDVRCRLTDVSVKRIDDEYWTASVTVALGRQVRTQTATVQLHAGDLPRAVAALTLQTIMDLTGPGHTLSLRNHVEVVMSDDAPISVVTVQRDETLERWVGAASATQLIEAVARATLDAVNRRLGSIMGDLRRQQPTQVQDAP
jgi:diguanylate cyclase (GGDEF)-like protein